MFSRIELLGFLRHDPQFITSAKGTPICRFQLGISKPNSPDMACTWYKIYVPVGKQYSLIKEWGLSQGDTIFVCGQFEYKGMFEGYPNLNVYAQEIHPIFTGLYRKQLEEAKQYIPEIIDNQEIKVNNQKEIIGDDYDMWGGNNG